MAGGATTRFRRSRLPALAVVTAALLAGAPAAAIAQAAEEGRGVDRVCDAGAQTAQPFADVEATTPQARAISCLWVLDVVQGRFADGDVHYDPQRPVDRQQMASLLANALRVLPRDSYVPPAGTEPDFPDADRISDVHRIAVARLQSDGIVAGYGDGTFRPGATISRGQSASFVAAALETVVGEELPRQHAFDDAQGAHAASIEKLAAIGVVDPTADAYRPAAPATRADLALFVARALDHLAAEGYVHRTAFAPPPADNRQGLADVSFADSGITLDVSAGEGRFGWEISYVDEAISQGTGAPVEVAGDAVLQVHLTGMALPPTLAQATWFGQRLSVDEAGIVEVVDAGVYEGRQLLFVGTTGRHAFTADLGADGRMLRLELLSD